MSGIGSLTGWDRTHLEWAASLGVNKMIMNHDDIQRIAERFCGGDMGVAFGDIFEKGLQEYLDMCDLDDKLSEQDEALMDSAPFMPNTPTGKGGSI